MSTPLIATVASFWNDPSIGIEWPLPAGGPILSAKDGVLPTLDAFDSPFVYDGVPLSVD